MPNLSRPFTWPDVQYARDAAGDIAGLLAEGGVRPLGDQLQSPRVVKQFSDLVGVTVATSNASVTSTLDVASPFGCPALKLEITFSTTAGRVEVTPAAVNIPNFAGHVGYTVWLDDATRLSEVSVFNGTTAYALYYQHKVTVFNANDLITGPRVALGGPLRTTNVVDGGFVYGTNSLQATKLRFTAPNPLNNTCTVWVLDCFIVEPQRPAIAFTFDDGFDVWATTIGPALVSAGFQGTFALNSASIDVGITSANVQALATAGHQIAAHNVNNYKLQTLYGEGNGENNGTGTSVSATGYLTEYRTAQAALEALGVDPQDFMYHPWVQGGQDMQAAMLMRGAGIDLARGVTNEVQPYGYPLRNNALNLRTFALDSTATLAQAKAALDSAITYGGLCVFMGHDFQAAAGAAIWATQDFLDLVEYAQGKGTAIDVLTMRQLRDRLMSLGLLQRRGGYENRFPVRCCGRLIGANFNSTADQAITLDTGSWKIEAIYVTKASVSLTTAAGGFYTAASKGGTAIVAAAQAYTGLTATTSVQANTMAATPNVTNNTIYLSLTTGQGSAATASVYVFGRPI